MTLNVSNRTAMLVLLERGYKNYELNLKLMKENQGDLENTH